MLTLSGAEELRSYVGKELGVSPWREIPQQAIDDFAAVTGDDQWIHVDPVRAAETELGSTIAHGCFLLALGPRFAYDMFSLDGFAYVLNVGYGTVRFTAPVPVGAKVRMRAVLGRVDEVPGGLRITVTQNFECEGVDRPVCIAQSLVRALYATPDGQVN
ncbi:MaoC family dehydratase [Nocardia sp. NPDC050793]|uniref:MaoC family dehydratase n=1 Tax=Nocardia sp. NPDC050793 TaxID=3155159 RepID=UPI00340067D8